MYGIIALLFYEPLKHIYKMVFHEEYRRYSWLVLRYGKTPRFTERSICVAEWKLTVPDVASFLSAYLEIFVNEIYAFRADSCNPLILDCGANIGLSVLFFKKNYPKAKVIAYEADPEICAILQHNMICNGIEDVEIINKAIWSSETAVQFTVDGADGGRIESVPSAYAIHLPSVSLVSILQRNSFDFVKIDIEGAEVEALKNCDNYLAQQKYVFVEYHSFHNRKQSLGMLINMFERNGFRVHIHPPFITQKPFLCIKQGVAGMDMQLNLFFLREKHEVA